MKLTWVEVIGQDGMSWSADIAVYNGDVLCGTITVGFGGIVGYEYSAPIGWEVADCDRAVGNLTYTGIDTITRQAIRFRDDQFYYGRAPTEKGVLVTLPESNGTFEVNISPFPWLMAGAVAVVATGVLILVKRRRYG